MRGAVVEEFIVERLIEGKKLCYLICEHVRYTCIHSNSLGRRTDDSEFVEGAPLSWACVSVSTHTTCCSKRYIILKVWFVGVQTERNSLTETKRTD